MSVKEFAKELERRTMNFAIRMIRLSSKFHDIPEGAVVRSQLTSA